MGFAGCGETPGGFEPGSHEPAENPQSEVSSNAQPDILSQTVHSLVRQGWSEKPARVVAQFNRRLLEVAWETDRTQCQWQKIVNLWGRLGTRPRLQRVVERMPEFASLLAGALEAREDAGDLIAQSIPNDSESRQIVSCLYGMFPEASDSVLLADALQRDRDLILRLYNHGSPQALVWLLKIPMGDEAARVYRQWVRGLLEEALDRRALHAEDDATERAIALLDIHAPAVSELLRKDELFRQKFLEAYWPRFCKALSIAARAEERGERDVLWMNYVGDPRVWRYYHELRDNGEDTYQVFERYGVVAVELMLAPEYRELRDEVFRFLRDSDERILAGLADHDLRSQPLFREFLRRKLPGWAVAQAVGLLLEKPAEAPRRLRYWQSLSDSALLEDLGPPPEGLKTWLPGYGLYYLAHKAAQGRDIGGADYVWAVADAATLAIPVGKPATLGRPLVQTAVRKGASRAVVSGTEKALAKAGTRAVAPLVINEAHLATRQKIVTALASKSLAAVDVTDAVRWSFGRLQSLGLGRKTFKALTGLEGRVFMRADRRVVLDVGKLFGGASAFGIVLRETAENAGFDLAMNTSVGQHVTQTGAMAVTQAPEIAAKQLEAWRQHLSAWWTALHTGAVDTALKDASQTGATKPTH